MPKALLGKRDFIADWGTIAAAALWTLWPFFVRSGIPAYQHDWSWPFLQQRSCDALATLGSTWLSEGLGHANPFANAHPINYLIGGLGCVVSEPIAMRLYLCLCAVVACYGCICLSRDLENRVGARFGAFAYLALPAFFNKVSAGQFAFWAAFAMLPWVYFFVHRLVRDPRPSRIACAGLTIALCMVQPQYVVFTAFLVVVQCAFLRASRRAIGAAVAAYLLALVLNAPAIWSAGTLNSAFGFTIQHPQLGWELSQSADMGKAIIGLGYAAGYAGNAYARLPFGLLSLALLYVSSIVAFGALVLRRDRLGYAFAFTAVFAIVFMSGVRGPLAFAFVWAFANIHAAALFRELYHMAPFLALTCALGLGTIVSWLPLAGRVAFITVVAGAVLPLAVCGHRSDLDFRSVPESVVAINEQVASLSPSRFLPLPYRMPIAWGDSQRSGIDELAYVDSLHPSAAEYAPTPELDAIVSLGRADQRLAQDLLARLSVGSVERRENLHAAVTEQYFGPARRASERAQVVFDHDAAAFRALTGSAACASDCVGEVAGRLPMLGIARTGQADSVDRGAYRRGVSYIDAGIPKRENIVASTLAISPFEGWVPAETWTWLDPSWAFLGDPLLVTSVASMLHVDVPAARTVAYVARGPLTVCGQTGCARYPAEQRPAYLSLPLGRSVIRSQGYAALAALPERVAIPTLSRGVRMTQVRQLSPYEYSGELEGHGIALVVLRQRFDTGWIFSLQGGAQPHVRVDAYANGWFAKVNGAHRFTIFFGPQRPFSVWKGLSLASYACDLCFLLVIAIYRKTRGRVGA